jgi:hypothetical protein
LEAQSVGNDQVIDPVDEPGIRLDAHPPGQTSGETIAREGGLDPAVDERLG